MKAAVFGASGYGGQVLMRLLLDHPQVSQVMPVSSTSAGTPIDLRDSGLGPDSAGKLPEGRILLNRAEALSRQPDAVFSALPHGASADFCAPFMNSSVVFDLSADFRLTDPDIHQKVYGSEAPMKEKRSSAVYGLAELYESQIKESDLIAVPGCYPTCSLLPLVPLARHGLVEGPVIINAVSGISGAGRSPKETSLYVERSENTVAYSPGTKHRHQSEMTQEIRKAGSHAVLFFTPHLAPMRRGMASTIALPLAGNVGISEDRIADILTDFYADKPFIGLRGGTIPSTRDVVGSNRCDIGWSAEDGIVYLFSVIDNLVKGASGQAVQDFNIRFGFPQTTGLPLRGEV